MPVASRGINNEIKWRLHTSFSADKEHALLYRTEFMNKGIQLEVITPRRKNGSFGEQKLYFFIDGDKREFKTQEELIKAIKGE